MEFVVERLIDIAVGALVLAGCGVMLAAIYYGVIVRAKHWPWQRLRK